MTIIIDKRKSGKNRSIENRKRFIDRYKKQIKKSIDTMEDDILIDKNPKNRKVKIKAEDIDEPEFALDRSTGKSERVIPGNTIFEKGDQISRPPKGGSAKRGGSNSKEKSQDEFSFVLTIEEFYNIYFSDLDLPDFVKESFKDNVKYKYVRSGYSKDGIPPRIDLPKTFKQAIARRICSKGTDVKPRFLDDIDLRYKQFVKKPIPIREAHVFFLMDVSASMGEPEKNTAKKFFYLFYLFLTQEYKYVHIHFISHTTEAHEVTQNDFFYSRESGGTKVSSGLALINKIIDESIDTESSNIYVAQASDGDNFFEDMPDTCVEMEELLRKVQYFAYIQIEIWGVIISSEAIGTVYEAYNAVKQHAPKAHGQKLQNLRVRNKEDIVHVFRELFKKKENA